MPFLGEVPITAFFSRVEPTSAKRKAITLNTSSNKKRKKDNEAIQKGPHISSSKGKNRIPGASNIIRKGGESSTSPVVLDPTSTPSLAVCSQPVSNLIDEVAAQRRTFFLPTPTTMPRPQSYHPAQSPRHSVAPDSQDPVLEPVQLSVHCTPTKPRNLFFFSSGRSQPSTPKQRDSFYGSIQPEFLQKGITIFEDFTSERGMPVCSSQSQLLSPVHESPPRPHTNLERLRSSTSSSDDNIPSSQVQERELTILSAESKLQTELTLLDATRVPAQTLSDELFSVPIQLATLSDAFPSDESAKESQPAPAAYASSGTDENIFDDSATESETDNEREDTNLDSEDGSFEEHKCSARPPSLPFQPESFPASLGISSSSLPPIVQVFHDMSFGSNDESYPPDFPMSLRS